MPLIPRRIEAAIRLADGIQNVGANYDGSSTIAVLGPLEVTVGEFQATTSWSVANSDSHAVRLDSITLVAEFVEYSGPVRMLRHGYQSWSPTDVATLGVDVDPSRMTGIETLQALHHADQRTIATGELRSEWVTLLVDATAHPVDRPLLVGFGGGGGAHDGTVRLRLTDGDRVEVRAEAFMGGAEMAPGIHRELDEVVYDDGAGDAASKLARWADKVGTLGLARTGSPYLVGWCSWYQYFHDVTEADLRNTLTRAASWPFDVIQIDDGYQRGIGDWLDTNPRFPTPLDGLADAIASTGRRPGLWLAPFLVAPNSEVATRHPDWIARELVDDVNAGPLQTCWNPPWGGGEGGVMYGLDTSLPEVQDHLAAVAADLVDAGFSYLKLDFTYSPSLEGGYSDPSRTPAERVRDGFEAIRRGAGDDAFLLGCGVPLSHVVGVVDAVRIGQDVAPAWSADPADAPVAGYFGMLPAVSHALTSTLARAPFHRRLWQNDPDCLLLRTKDTQLTETQVMTWAKVVGISGGMALVSDDLALLGDRERSLLEDTLSTGRASDAEAKAGRTATCPDLLNPSGPSRLVGGGREVTCDLATGESTTQTSPREKPCLSAF
jgi:alpha-galactosidase